MVPFDSLHCQVCDAITGVVWLAVIAQDQSTIVPEVGSYLDVGQRYLVIEALPPTERVGEQQLKVLDCQPFQPTLLDVLMAQDLVLPMLDKSALDESGLDESALESAIAVAASARSEGTNVAQSLPLLAHPYLALRDQFYQALPLIRDAWKQENQQTIVLEDRSHLPLLLEFWNDEEVSLPLLQVSHWLYETVELWEALAPLGCCQSLLEANNLRIDEDQALCLQRIYPDQAESPPTLQDLGQFWKTLFIQSQRTQFDAFSALLTDLKDGKIETTDSLRSHLEAIADAHQPIDAADLELENLQLEDLQLSQPSEFAVSSAELLELEAEDEPELTLAVIPTQLETDEGQDGDNEPTVVLPMQLFSLDDVGRTDIGRQRPHNEDYFGIETQVVRLESPTGKTVNVRNLYVLCDGMGGQADGEVASALAVDTLRRFFRDRWQSSPFAGGQTRLPGAEVMHEAVQLANKAIYDINQENARSGSGRMGTTLVMALVADTEMAIAHVGDSRLYRYTRKRGLEQITVDHEVGQREILRGVDPEIAYARPDAYQLTQALGPRDEHFIKPDVQYLEINEDMLFLLCSDGLTDNDLLETHYRTHVEPLLSSQANLEQGVSQLIDLANKHNGHDNITAIAIRAKVRPDLAHLR
jgi:serine/threonine protein phosphatase PrpC